MAASETVKASILLPRELWKDVKRAALDADQDLQEWVREAIHAKLASDAKRAKR